ncbi:MAG TPA: helix-turn-helix domain-containing protein [Bradyrhizobium sp.]|uniref:GlxA family transcriptional regulator n=1 Tax=Bradyrhizobium sp. TaxID=376 RepID=UPI002D7FF29D|nr:helix-turn-helix domain-containing protein [Bradyrhizobium sp.]HET7888175.1 helix-turn-helix domain-containing protein [Bradyrhizobium sp.]
MPLIKIWVYDDILASSVAGCLDVFTAANYFWSKKQGGNAQSLKWRLESLDAKPIRTASGQVINVDGPIGPRSAADAVIVPGPFVTDVERFFARADLMKPLCSALRAQHQRGALLASYCTGSFILAEAGLLEGGLATTHWAKAKIFAQRYPAVELSVSEILTEQNNIICSGAVTTALNMALRIVEKLLDARVAGEVGRIMLIDRNRASQASYAAMEEEAEHSDALVARAQRAMQKSLQAGFNLGELAGALSVSERTLNRRFKRATGEAPLQYLQSLRVDVAKRLLQAKRLTVDAVGERVGYRDLSTFRRLFKRETGLSPRDYQRRFSSAN